MATKLEGDIKRGDMFLADPAAIVIPTGRRGRKFAPGKDDVKRLAISMLTGQLQPCSVRRIAGGALELVAGFTRHEAVCLIREGFEYEGQEYKDADYRLKVVLTQVAEGDAFKAAIRENNDRNVTTPVDDAFNQQELRDRYGMTDGEIAKFYGYPDGSKVTRLKKLLTLPDATLRKLHGEQISFNVAVRLAEVPAAHHEALTAPTEEGRAPSLPEVKARLEELSEELEASGLDGPSDATGDMAEEGERKTKKAPPKKVEQRTIKQVRLLLEIYTTDETSPPIRAYSNVVLAYLTGQCSKKDVEALVRKIEGGIPEVGKYA